ncbi:hypothetical protein ACHAPF_005833 [Botrytis cinerea]
MTLSFRITIPILLNTRGLLRLVPSSPFSGSPYGRITLWFFGKAGRHSSSIFQTRVLQFIWKVDLSGANGNPKFDLNAGNAFFFGIFNSGTTDLFESQFVNITGKNVIVSTTSSSASTTSVSSAASTDPMTSTNASSAALSSTTDQPSSTSTSSSSSVTPTASSAPVSTQSSGELSVGAKAGIGIGSVIAFFSIVGAAFALGRFFRRPKAPHTHPESATIGHSSFAPSTTTAVTSGSQQWYPLVEAPRDSEIQKPENRIYEI